MKLGFFITARLKSQRLKQKILLDLNGKSVLDRVIDRCKKIEGINNVVLCTSTNPQDSILEKNANNNKILFFKGSEDDVLDRLLKASQQYDFDAFLSITADNPLFSIEHSQRVIDWYKNEHFDFIFTKGLPIGCSSYFIDSKALEVAHLMKMESSTEIWGPFVNRPDFFKIGELIIKNSPFDENTRITCDYPEDYDLIRKIYSFFPNEHIPSIHEVFNLLIKYPELLKLNSNRKQTKVKEETIKSIQKQFNSQKVRGLQFANEIGKKLSPKLKQLEVKI